MTGPSAKRDGFGLVGLGVVACVACCAGPILALLGGLTIAGLASTLVIGIGGLAVAAVSAVAWLAVRRRHNSCGDGGIDGPVPLAPPTSQGDEMTSADH